MDHEQGQFGLPVLPYPDRIRPSDLERIEGYRKDRRSAGESVARLITVDDIAELMEFTRALPVADRTLCEIGVRAYAHPALAFLTAAFTKALATPPPAFGNTDDDIHQIVDHALLGSPLVPSELHDEQAWRQLHVEDQVRGFTLAAYLKTVLESEGVLAVIDRYTDIAIRRMNTHLATHVRPLCREAIQKGRDRFHQLFNAASR